MTARTEIEKQQLSLDSRMRPMYQKRTVSVSNFRTMPSGDIEMQQNTSGPGVPGSVGGAVPTVHATSKRQKSVSVCIAALPTSQSLPRTLDQYEQQTLQNGFPQALSAYELRHVRLPALSTSEVFNEPPGLYVYRERPVTTPFMHKEQKWSFVEFAKKRKHTLIAWGFGIIAITAVMVIIILQTKGDFS